MSVRKLYNPDAYADNTLVMHKSKSGCCGDSLDFCKYSFDISGWSTVEGITLTIDGVATAVTFDSAATTPKELRIAVAEALKANGYDPYADYADSWRGIQADTDSLVIVGEAVIASVQYDAGSTANATVLCTTGAVCKFRTLVELDTDPGKISYDGSAGTQVATIAGWSTGTDTDTIAAAYTAALNTETAPDYKVEVEEDLTNGVFIVDIYLVGVDEEILIDGESLTGLGCYPEFVSA